MWPFSDAFMKGLRRRARQQLVRRQPEEDSDDRTFEICGSELTGFFIVKPENLGELCALILAQAQLDGATGVRIYYGKNRMVYTISGIDYDMFPLPAPSNVDFVRAISKNSGMRSDLPGRLPVRFADMDSSFMIERKGEVDDPYLAISGFTGEASLASDGTVREPFVEE